MSDRSRPAPSRRAPVPPVRRSQRALVQLAVLGLAAALPACREVPPTTVRVQGRVRSLGLQVPIPGAQVTVQWPSNLGGGESALRTNTAGRFAVERSARLRQLNCNGVAIAVEADGYATAYNRYTGTDCTTDSLNFNFTLYPIPR